MLNYHIQEFREVVGCLFVFHLQSLPPSSQVPICDDKLLVQNLSLSRQNHPTLSSSLLWLLLGLAAAIAVIVVTMVVVLEIVVVVVVVVVIDIVAVAIITVVEVIAVVVVVVVVVVNIGFTR